MSLDITPSLRPEPHHALTDKTVIVAGIGRSGTGYLAKVLEECGLKAGHKKVFRGGGTPHPCVDCLRALDVEVSGFAMPHLWERRFRHFPVVQLVRHPLAWLRSWRRKRYAAMYLRAHVPGYQAPRPIGPGELRVEDFAYGSMSSDDRFVERAMDVWVKWNVYVAQRASVLFRVENVAPRDVRAVMTLAQLDHGHLSDEYLRQQISMVPKNFNSAIGWDTEEPLPKWGDVLRLSGGRRVYQLARRFGYTPSKEP